MGCDQDGLAFLPGGSGSFDPEPGRWPSGRRFVPHRTSEPRVTSASPISSPPKKGPPPLTRARRGPTPSPSPPPLPTDPTDGWRHLHHLRHRRHLRHRCPRRLRRHLLHRRPRRRPHAASRSGGSTVCSAAEDAAGEVYASHGWHQQCRVGTSRPYKLQDCANRTWRAATTVIAFRRPSFGGGAGAQKRVILCFARSERACRDKL